MKARQHLGLTPGEWRIVLAICAGHTTYKSIARQCCISQRTVQTHLAAIYPAVGVDNMPALVLRVMGDSEARKAAWPWLKISEITK